MLFLMIILTITPPCQPRSLDARVRAPADQTEL